MADAPDLPEAKDPFEKGIALTIAIFAVVLSFVDNTGDNAKTDAIVKTTEAANKWAYFQSKSLKENLADSSATLLGLLTATDPAAAKAKQEELVKEVARYEGEKKQLMTEARELEQQSAHALAINDRSDLASLLLQIAVVVCSIAILVRWKPIFFGGVAVGLAGIAVAATAFMM
jgi:hypothetical protein